MPDSRFDAAIVAIDAANSDDPDTIVVDGVVGPKEQAHARMMTAWVNRLDPQASDAQLLAARAHHLRRWAVPRSTFPEGRPGYLRWRREQQRRHATEVAEILDGVGYDAGLVAEVQRIIRKEGLGRDQHVQTHEDALCLVFLETQFAELTDRIGDDRIVEVLAKTLRKMSPAAIAHADDLALTPDQIGLLRRARSG